MKKLRSVLVLSLVAALLAGAFPANAAEEVVIQFLYYADATQEAIVEDACRNYEAGHPGVKIETQVIPGDQSITTVIPTLIASNDLPDISYMAEADVIKYAAKGILQPLDEYLESGMIAEKLDSVTIRGIDGMVYGIGLSNQLQVMYYNKDLFDAAGLPYPSSTVDEAWEWDDFVETAKKLTVDASGKHPGEEGFDAGRVNQYGVAFNSMWQFYSFWGAYANGGGIVSADGSKLLMGQENSMEGLQKIADLMNKDQVAPPVGSAIYSGIGTADAALIAGNVAMYINGSWDIANAAKAQGITNYGVAVLPKMENAVTMNAGGPVVMYKNTDHPQEVAEFYAYMTDPSQVIDILKTGVWLPNEESWYTDADKIDQWTSGPNFTQDIKDTVLSYSNTPGSIAQWPVYYVPAWDAMMSITDSVMDSIWNGSKTVKEALESVMPQIQEKFDLGVANFD